MKFKSEVFGIKHFAGSVYYSIENFVDKNKNSMNQFIFGYLGKSTNGVLSSIFS